MDAVEIPAETITANILSKCSMPIGDDHDERFGVPLLEELGKMFIYLPSFLHACLFTYVYVIIS